MLLVAQKKENLENTQYFAEVLINTFKPLTIATVLDNNLVLTQEKEKVLSYQRQLQLNYVQMYRRTRSLESQLQSLSLGVDADVKHRKAASLNAIQL